MNPEPPLGPESNYEQDYDKIMAARNRPDRPERAYGPVICQGCGRLDDDDLGACPACDALIRQLPAFWDPDGEETLIEYLQNVEAKQAIDAAYWEERERLRAEAQQAPATEPPVRQPGETDESYLERLAAYINRTPGARVFLEPD